MSTDREISWRELLPSGEETVEGDILRFVSEVVRLQPKSRIPPYKVFCDMLSRGVLGGGMGGGLAWDPEAIMPTESEYTDCALRISGGGKLPKCDALSLEEWRAWCGKIDLGLDYDEHLKLLNALRVAELKKGTAADPEGLQYLSALSSYFSFVCKR